MPSAQSSSSFYFIPSMNMDVPGTVRSWNGERAVPPEYLTVGGRVTVFFLLEVLFSVFYFLGDSTQFGGR